MIDIIIHKNTTPNKLNRLYEKYLTEQSISIVTLTIPVSLNKYTFGLLADMLKLVITLNNNVKIETLIIDADSEDLDSLYDQEYAYPIISLLWNISTFFDKNHINVKSILRQKQNEYLFKMNSLSKFKGNKYILTNTDHLSKNKGLIRLFENNNGFNDDEVQITNSVRNILNNHVLTFNKSNKKEIYSIIDDLGAIVYELMKNTFEWGRTDSMNVEIPSSVRGVYFRFHKNYKNKIIEEFVNTPLQSFFTEKYVLENCVNQVNQIYFLEILVFDSGIGFIEKFHNQDELSDLEIIKKCLIKNQTSSTSNLKTKKGIGLDRILNILNKKGFLHIQTDKYTVYRDLVKDNHSSIEIDHLNELRLDDWNNNDFNTENFVKAKGSYVSILYPFKANI